MALRGSRVPEHVCLSASTTPSPPQKPLTGRLGARWSMAVGAFRGSVRSSTEVQRKRRPPTGARILRHDKSNYSRKHCVRSCRALGCRMPFAPCERRSPCGLRPKQWPQIRRDYPLNLSISISGGKETNKDSPSNGE
jgi:hypothetical protein